MLSNKLYIAIALISLFLALSVGCSDNKSICGNTLVLLLNDDMNSREFPLFSPDYLIEEMTINIRNETINEVVNLKTDSILISKSDLHSYYTSYSKGKIIAKIAVSNKTNDTIAFSYISPTTGFNANGENCSKSKDGSVAGSCHKYRGLKYNGKHLGIATYVVCDKSSFKKGIYHYGKRIGDWTTIDSTGKAIETIKHGNKEIDQVTDILYDLWSSD